MLNRIPTWIVADFESILLKEEAIKGVNSKIIHKHQPCAWGLTVVTDRKGSRYDKTFCHIGESTEEAMATFCSKIIEIAQMVYQHERMLIPMEKLEREKKRNFDNAISVTSATTPSMG